MSEYGNTGWVTYVFAAYASVALGLTGFVAHTLKMRASALRRLKDEGGNSDSD